MTCMACAGWDVSPGLPVCRGRREAADVDRRQQAAGPPSVRGDLEWGNWETADELYAPEYVNHDPYNPGQGTGPDGFKRRVGRYRGVLHDFDLRIERQIAEGDWVETHWSLRGIHGGELEGTAPTGRSVYVDGQLLSHIVDGKFVEEWVHWDTLGLLRQIGAVPPPPS
jgi:predicted ester cyclase